MNKIKTIDDGKLIIENKRPNLFVWIFIIWHETIAPKLKVLPTNIIQKDLNLSGKTSDKLFVLIFIIIPKQNPIIDRLINNIIQEGMTHNKLKEDMVNKLNIIIFFLTNLFERKPEQRLPKAIKSIRELETKHPFIWSSL